MANYLLAQVQLRYSNKNLEIWSEAVALMRDMMAEEGVILKHGMVTQLGGRLFEIWNLWEVEDAEHMNRARRSVHQKDTYRKVHAMLADIIEAETFRYLQSLPYAPDNR